VDMPTRELVSSWTGQLAEKQAVMMTQISRLTQNLSLQNPTKPYVFQNIHRS